MGFFGPFEVVVRVDVLPYNLYFIFWCSSSFMEIHLTHIVVIENEYKKVTYHISCGLKCDIFSTSILINKVM